MERPWIKLFTRDWLDDLELRRCSPLARSVLFDLMCIASEGIPHGYLADRHGPLSEAYLAGRCVIRPAQLRTAIRELTAHARLHQAGSTFFIKRMVRDEEIRQRRAAGGSASIGHPKVPIKDILQGHLIGSPYSSRDTRVCADSESVSGGLSEEESARGTTLWEAAGFKGSEYFELWWAQIVAKHPNKNHNVRARGLIFELIVTGQFKRERFELGYGKLMESNRKDWTKEGGRYCTNLYDIIENRLYSFEPSIQPEQGLDRYETPEERDARITREDAERRQK